MSDIISTGTNAGKDYVSVGLSLNEFRSIEILYAEVDEDTGEEVGLLESVFPKTAQTYSMFGTLGTHITEYVRTELRLGTGIKSDTVDDSLELNMHYWFAWYMGATYPLDESMSVYGLYGISFYDADVTRKEKEILIRPEGALPTTKRAIPSALLMEEDLFGTKFSTSWVLGMDFSLLWTGLSPQWRLAAEYGRLLRDTDSNIKVNQANLHLRYTY